MINYNLQRLLRFYLLITMFKERQKAGQLLSKIRQIQALVRYGLYDLTEHADDEAMEDDLTIYDVEYGILNGKIRRTWPKDGKFEVVGVALDGRPIDVVCRITERNQVRVIPVDEDRL